MRVFPLASLAAAALTTISAAAAAALAAAAAAPATAARAASVPAGPAGAIALLTAERYRPIFAQHDEVVVVVCGGSGVNWEIMEQWKRDGLWAA